MKVQIASEMHVKFLDLVLDYTRFCNAIATAARSREALKARCDFVKVRAMLNAKKCVLILLRI